jgi:HSP20 family protein
MALVRWRPRNDSFFLDPFFARFDELFREWPSEDATTRSWHPALDLDEEKDRLVARLELPGVDPGQVEINLQGDMLTVRGERKDERESKEGTVLKREQVYGSFQRSVQLPYRVQPDQVKAEYKNGVMTILLPKAEEYVGRQIQVEVK